MLPSIPAWSELHPVVVHFPVALLTVAPLLVMLALMPGRFAPGLRVAAAAVMVLGAAAAFLAVGTGEAAAGLHPAIPPRPAALLEQHEQLGEAVRALFAGLAAVYLAILVLPGVMRRTLPRWLAAGLQLVFLVGYLAALPVLLRTASLGGELVHRWGVRGFVTDAPAAPEERNGGDAAGVP